MKNEIKKDRESSRNNSSFEKLLKLQSTLQEEIALRDIFFENRDSLLKKVENNCIEYYKTLVSIQEIYDNKSQTDSSKKKIKYIFCDKPQSEMAQYYDHLSSIFFYFHDNNELTLKLISYCPKEKYAQLANFICNYFYVNIFSSTFLNENLLTLLYLFLEKEIDELTIKEDNNDNLLKPFLDRTNSFTPYLLECLTRKDEIKTYLENILKKVLIRTSGLSINQRDNLFLGFDIKKMLAFLNGQNYQIKKTNKTFKSYLNLLTTDIKKCKLNIIKKKNKENEDSLYTSYASYASKTTFDEKNNYENNFYSMSTKEIFDNLLLGDNINLNKEENEDDSSEGDEDISKDEKNISIVDINNKNKKDDFENFLINSGFYYRNNETIEEKKRESNRFDIYNNVYTKELNKETILELIEKEDDRDVEDYLLKQINIIQDNEKGNVFTNTKLINEIIHLGINSEDLNKVILIYKYHFESIKIFLDELFTSLILNKESVQ